MSNHLTTQGKAKQINLDIFRYGTFAEIGAGQEVARQFFQAGKASQTIAKSMSAYDMVVSDDIYGREENGRYVCESRLMKMLQHESDLLVSRLQDKRDSQTCFFTFADTVATANVEENGKQSHGWLGVRFQSTANGQMNDIVLHVRMLDKFRLQQQEALSILGVNLIHAAFYCLQDKENFIDRLFDNLKDGQVVIDVIKFHGPNVLQFDHRLMNLELVRRDYAEAILFSPQFEILNFADAVYNKCLLIQRGTYRPITQTHLDVLTKGSVQLEQDCLQVIGKNLKCLPIVEITTSGSAQDPLMTKEDLLARAETLTACGLHVLITNFSQFHRMKEHIRRYNPQPMAFVIGAHHLDKLFDETYYKDLSGGTLEGLGKLLDQKSKVYVYPHKTEQICLTAKVYSPKPPYHHIYQYFKETKNLIDISGCDESGTYYHSSDAQKLLSIDDIKWREIVPTAAVKIIESKKLFGYQK